MAVLVRSGLNLWVIILQVLLLNFISNAVLGEDSADLTDEDWKTLGFNLVVLKDQVDAGFAPNGEPLSIQGSYHTATLQKYTKDKQCFQLLTIDCDMIEKGKMKDSVKISCETTVANPDMKSTGIKIGNIIAELSPGRFLFIVQGGGCHRRLYLTFSQMVMNRDVDDHNCRRFTGSEKEDRARGVIAMLSENVPLFSTKKGDKTKDEIKDKLIVKSKDNIGGKDETNDKDVNKANIKVTAKSKGPNVEEKGKGDIKKHDKSKDKSRDSTRYDDENIS